MTTTSSDSLTAAAHRYLWMHFTPMSAPTPTSPSSCAARARGSTTSTASGTSTASRACSSRRSVTVAPSSPTPPPKQARTLAYFPVWSYAHPGAIELAERLADLAPGDLERVFFTTGGSEAVESAWKLARQYFQAIGQPHRYKVIGRHIAYHGTTMGALSITGVPAIKMPVRTARSRRGPRRQHQPVPARADRPRGGDRARDRDGRTGERRGGVPRAGAELGRLLPADRRLLPAGARDLRRDRRAARLRRGDLRVRASRPLVRFAALRLPARHHHDGQGHDVGLLADRRHDRAAASRRAVPARPQDVPARHHVRRPSGELRGRAREPRPHGTRRAARARARERRRVPRDARQAARPPDRRRRARRGLLLRHRAREGQGHEDVVQRRGERAPAARLPLAARCTTPD